MQQTIISTKGPRLWQGIPTIERAASGRLWCAFFSGGPTEPDPANTILLTTSVDGGTSWSAPQAVVEPFEGWRAYDPCLWHDPQGRLWLFYNRAAEGKGGYVEALICEDATPDRLSWSEPLRVGLGLPFSFRLNKPTVIANGDWLLPVTYMKTAPEHWFGTDDQLQGVAISSDRGQSWRLHGELLAPPWALENMILERRDGRLWMLIRTSTGVLWQSFSADGGFTWALPGATTIANPGSRFFIRRLQSGRVLFINTPNPHARNTLVAFYTDGSDDAPFIPGLMLDPRDQVSYPDAVQAPDGTIYAVHDCGRQAEGEIVLNVFSEDELLAQSQ